MKSLVSTVILVKTLEELIGTASSFTVKPSLSVHAVVGARTAVGARSGSPLVLPYRDASLRQWERLVIPQGGLRMSGDGATDDAPKPRRQRRRRKDSAESNGQENSAATAAADPVQPGGQSVVPESPMTPPVVVRSNSAVQLEVVDVRDFVAGRPASPTVSSSATSRTSSPLQQDLPPSQTYSTSSVTTASSQTRQRSDDDAFARLLRDAQQMQQAERDEAGDASSSSGFSLPSAAKSAISTLITVDFFLICGFLLWFLAGIFASTVLQNDAIQIAFNGIFQPVVQPALGVLMIGSIASAVFKGDEEDAGDSP